MGKTITSNNIADEKSLFSAQDERREASQMIQQPVANYNPFKSEMRHEADDASHQVGEISQFAQGSLKMPDTRPQPRSNFLHSSGSAHDRAVSERYMRRLHEGSMDTIEWGMPNQSNGGSLLKQGGLRDQGTIENQGAIPSPSHRTTENQDILQQNPNHVVVACDSPEPAKPVSRLK